jgi:hypothetical protein
MDRSYSIGFEYIDDTSVTLASGKVVAYKV